MMLEKCPDKNAFIEFSLQTILVSANATGQDNLSQMLANIKKGLDDELFGMEKVILPSC
jgi:hypothetical protein